MARWLLVAASLLTLPGLVLALLVMVIPATPPAMWVVGGGPFTIGLLGLAVVQAGFGLGFGLASLRRPIAIWLHLLAPAVAATVGLVGSHLALSGVIDSLGWTSPEALLGIFAAGTSEAVRALQLGFLVAAMGCALAAVVGLVMQKRTEGAALSSVLLTGLGLSGAALGVGLAIARQAIVVARVNFVPADASPPELDSVLGPLVQHDQILSYASGLIAVVVFLSLGRGFRLWGSARAWIGERRGEIGVVGAMLVGVSGLTLAYDGRVAAQEARLAQDVRSRLPAELELPELTSVEGILEEPLVVITGQGIQLEPGGDDLPADDATFERLVKILPAATSDGERSLEQEMLTGVAVETYGAEPLCSGGARAPFSLALDVSAPTSLVVAFLRGAQRGRACRVNLLGRPLPASRGLAGFDTWPLSGLLEARAKAHGPFVPLALRGPRPAPRPGLEQDSLAEIVVQVAASGITVTGNDGFRLAEGVRQADLREQLDQFGSGNLQWRNVVVEAAPGVSVETFAAAAAITREFAQAHRGRFHNDTHAIYWQLPAVPAEKGEH